MYTGDLNMNSVHFFADSLSLTNIADVQGGSTGHQPMGYDQWTQFYQEWMVIWADVHITFTNAATGYTAGLPPYCGAYYEDAGSANPVSTDFPFRVVESERGPSTQLAVVDGGADAQKSLSLSYSTKQFWNIDDIRDNWSDFSGYSDGTGPVENARLITWISSPNSVAYPDNGSPIIGYTILVDYYVLWRSPFALPVSGPHP